MAHIVFTRRGDFMEVAGPYSLLVAQICGVTVSTCRKTGAPSVGLPMHSFDDRCAELVFEGHTVEANK